MAGDGADLGRLIGRALGEAGWDVESAAERLMRMLGDGADCLLALDQLGDLVDEARLVADGPEQLSSLLRLRVSYRSAPPDRR